MLLPAITTLETVTLPENLSGQNGTNRAAGNHPQISANTDIDAIKAWLARYLDTPTTFNNYRKEAERLLLWSTVQIGKPLSSLTHEDCLVYQHFLKNPQPSVRWVLPNGRKVGRSHPDWRPFAGPLSPASQRQAIVILNAMFSWLVNAGYLAGNPLSLSRQRAKRQTPRITRYLEEDLWQEVKLTIDQMPRETDRQREHYYRTRWLFSLLYLCGLRVSEVVGNQMGGFFYRRDKNGEERWWLEVLGKGDKLRIVPATNELMVELTRYRRELSLSLYPTPNESTPLLLPIGGKLRSMTRAAVHELIKAVFENTANRLLQRGAEFRPKADRLAQASAHWLRHTAGSHMANNEMDLRHVRDTLGHESLTTTSIYLHSSEDDRHRDTEDKHKIRW